ncbi:PIG-L deacetylase family protein [Nonomuraea sp. NPDC050451]|uniref:PIG-L deacetylase family protein n=1 Tax=Nonomuraea sp. NPDC050451 TaxID=3364364 RepID=UPI0037A605EA
MATLLAFHAHPDDEVLLTGGTLARAADEGHRVIVVVATDGVMKSVAEGGTTRMNELRAAAAVLGVARVEHLGYADSGHGKDLYPDPPDRMRFVRASTEEAAARLAAILREEQVDLLLSYDPNGGYGHRDHVKVHEVGRRAAALAKAYSPGKAITHRIDVRRYAGQKQRALAAHHSQISGDGRLSAVARVLVRLPAPVFGRLLGREWYVEAK